MACVTPCLVPAGVKCTLLPNSALNKQTKNPIMLIIRKFSSKDLVDRITSRWAVLFVVLHLLTVQ